MYLLVKCFYFITRKDETKDVSEEIDILEKWTIGDESK